VARSQFRFWGAGGVLVGLAGEPSLSSLAFHEKRECVGGKRREGREMCCQQHGMGQAATGVIRAGKEEKSKEDGGR